VILCALQPPAKSTLFPYTTLFRSQYELNLQYAGAGLPWDETVTRGAMGRLPFTVFYMQSGMLVAAAGFNDHHTVARARRVMEARKMVSAQQLADPNFDLRRVLA